MSATSQRKARFALADRNRPHIDTFAKWHLGGPDHGSHACHFDRSTVRGVTDLAVQRFRQGAVSTLADVVNVVLILFLLGLLIAALPLRSYRISSPPGEGLLFRSCRLYRISSSPRGYGAASRSA
jgi:hypothetical protein